MASPPPPKRQKLSALAEKYNHPTGKLHTPLALYTPFKSGITPLSPGPFRTEAEVAKHRALERYQRDRFLGFTTEELLSLEAFAPYNVSPGLVTSLKVPIHPLYERKHWDTPLLRHLGKSPLRNGRPGYWEASNPIVWEALKPGLQLASQILMSAHTWPWWDALLVGEYSFVPAHRIREEDRKKPLANFKLRNVSEYRQHAARDKVQQMFTDSAGRFDLRLVSGHSQIRSGYRDHGNFTYGRTIHAYEGDVKPMLLISYELVECLLRDDLTDAERALDTFRLAATVIHETCHMLWTEQVRFDHLRYSSSPDFREPYFENEVQSELGFSLENAIFGGVARGLVEGNDDLGDITPPIAGILQLPFPSHAYSDYETMPTIGPEPAGFRIIEIAPIPVQFFMNIYRPDYWGHHVKRFGDASTKMGPKAMANLYELKSGTGKVTRPRVFPHGMHNYQTLVIDPTWMSEEEIGAARIENDRRALANKIDSQYNNLLKRDAAILEAQQKIVLEKYPAPPKPDALRDKDFDCPRFDEIKAFLIRYRFELALDTMTFTIPEDTLYRYITEQGGLSLTGDEWRDFLFACDVGATLFSYSPGLVGIVNRISSGWGIPHYKSHTCPPTKPSAAIRASFKAATLQLLAIRQFGGFMDGFMDHDLDDFRRRINIIMTKQPELHVTEAGRKEPIKQFSDRLFYACLWYCDAESDMWIFGPAGVIRWLGDPKDDDDGAGGGDGDGDDGDGKKKGKRGLRKVRRTFEKVKGEIRDTCHPM